MLREAKERLFPKRVIPAHLHPDSEEQIKALDNIIEELAKEESVVEEEKDLEELKIADDKKRGIETGIL